MHGAALFNGIFMLPGSVVIDLLNGPYIEYFFSSPLKEAQINILYVPVLNTTIQCHACLKELKEKIKQNLIPSYCLNNDALTGGKVECIALRQCDVHVDIQLFRQVVFQAYSYVLSTKWIAPLLQENYEEI